MKTVAAMTMPEFQAAVQAESVLVAGEIADVANGLPAKTNSTEASLALAITFLAKERVWRKDLNARLEALEAAKA